MRAVVKPGPGPGCHLVTDRAEPGLEPHEVRVEVAATSVCGTDAALVAAGDAGGALAMSFPRTLGHEVAGTVVEVGRAVVGLAPGARVAVESHLHCGACWFCRNGHAHNCARMGLLGLTVDGGFAERVVVPARSCLEVPEAMPLEVAALLEPAGSAMHAVLRSGVTIAGSSVLVTGAGPVGLVAARVVLALGARHVVVVEPNPHRRRFAVERGVPAGEVADDPVASADRETRERGGFDLALECSGAAAALSSALRSVRREATVVCVGLVKDAVPLDVVDTLVSRGVTLRGSWGRSLWGTWDHLTALVTTRQVELGDLVTHRLPLGQLPTALDLMRAGSGKVLLLPALPEAADDGEA